MREQKEFSLKSGNYPIKEIDAETGKEIIKDNFVNFGRDEGKYFRLIEMPALQRERWHFRALALLRKDTQDNIKEISEVAEKYSATVAFYAMLDKNPKDWEAYIELCNEYLYCYEILDKTRGGDLGTFVKLTPENISEYINENSTIAYLRQEAVAFHNHFFMSGSGQNSPKPTDSQLPPTQP